jgi:hypothetical protein
MAFRKSRHLVIPHLQVYQARMDEHDGVAVALNIKAQTGAIYFNELLGGKIIHKLSAP